MRDIARVEPQLTKRDFTAALLLGVAAFCFVKASSPAGMDPAMWSEAAVAAGLKPPQFMFPGLWRIIAGAMFRTLGVGTAVEALSWAGAAAGAVSVAMVYAIVRMLFVFKTRLSVSHPVWLDRIVPGFAIAAAAFFAVSSPFLSAWQSLTPEALRFFALLWAVYAYMRWITEGGTWRIWIFTALTGLMAAETPVAFLLPGFMAWGYFATWRLAMAEMYHPPKRFREPDKMPVWRILSLFLGSFAAMVLANVEVFKAAGGMAANGWGMQDAYFWYATGYARIFFWASNLRGWIFGLGCCVFPMLVALKFFTGSVRDDKAMRFICGAMLLFMAALALLQTGAIPYTRFWVLTGVFAQVRSGFLMLVYALCGAISLAAVGAVFAFECQMKYLPADKRPGWKLKYLPAAVTVLAIASAAFGTRRGVDREIAGIIHDSLEETIHECGDAKWLFTDGRLDDAILLAAKAYGKDVEPVNLLSGPSKYEENLRKSRFPKGSADRATAAIGNASLFRVWAGENQRAMNDSAIQLGLELWRRDKKSMPAISGFVARPAGMTEVDVRRGREAAAEIAERILETTGKIGGGAATPSYVGAMQAIQWRISRLARFREEVEFADRLDGMNFALQHSKGVAERERRRALMQMTPREGLVFALHRADFIEARRFASAILADDPSNPVANFGAGMGYLLEDDLQNAEIYLKRVLEKLPEEPAALNNLSIIARRLGRFDEAEDLARRAIKVLPDSPEVRQTLRDAINRMREE